MMRQVNNFTSSSLFLLFSLIIGTVFWFSSVYQANLNPDEPVWIAQTEFFHYRLQKDWSKFNLQIPSTRLGWGSFNNQVVDQPQAGKYMMGTVLEITNSNPWKIRDQRWAYDDFVRIKIPSDGSPRTLSQYLGSEIVRAIEIIRIFETTLAWITLLALSGLMYWFHKSLVSTGITFLLMVWHSVFSNYLRKAMQDSASLLFLLISGSLVVLSLENLKARPKRAFILIVVAGIISGITASIKINGFFLLGFPVALSFMKVVIKEWKLKKEWKKICSIHCVYFFCFFATFIFLEPTTWQNPTTGIQAFFQSRLTQQERFYKAFNFIPAPLVPNYLLYIFVMGIQTLPAKIAIFIPLALGSSHTIIQIKKKQYKSILLITTNSYYAQTGFDRYLIPSICTLFFFVSIGIQKIIAQFTHD
jgi:hypothetical protein